MKNIVKILIIVTVLHNSATKTAADPAPATPINPQTTVANPHIIFLSFKDYPEKSSDDPVRPYARVGINVAYYGYLGITRKDGTFAFKRSHQKPSVSLLICNNIQPVFMLKNTISHWEVAEQAPYELYTISRIQDVQTKKYIWDTQKTELPTDKKLPTNTIFVFGQPSEFYIPTGVSKTNNNPNLILPELFVKSSIKHAKNSLAMLEITQFFEHVQHTQKIEGSDQQKKS